MEKTEEKSIYVNSKPISNWFLNYSVCPSCEQLIAFVARYKSTNANPTPMGEPIDEMLVYPRSSSRPLPLEVPEEFRDDFNEACLTLSVSPKASAALSRRCLQHLLREKGGVKYSDLSKEIDEVMPTLPAHLAGAIDGVRHIGNYAVHPMKSKQTGEIVAVEPGEAEWLLETLESLFDFYFVGPARLQAKRAAVNAKLTEIGKPPLKGSQGKP